MTTRRRRKRLDDEKPLRERVDMNKFGILEDDDNILAISMAQKEGITLRELQKEIDSLSQIKARDYPQHETNRERAVAKFRQCLHVRKAQCDKVIEQIAGDKVAKAEWEEYKSRSWQLAEKEADICQIGNIKEIAWVPSGGHPSRREAGKVVSVFSVSPAFSLTPATIGSDVLPAIGGGIPSGNGGGMASVAASVLSGCSLVPKLG